MFDDWNTPSFAKKSMTSEQAKLRSICVVFRKSKQSEIKTELPVL